MSSNDAVYVVISEDRVLECAFVILAHSLGDVTHLQPSPPPQLQFCHCPGPTEAKTTHYFHVSTGRLSEVQTAFSVKRRCVNSNQMDPPTEQKAYQKGWMLGSRMRFFLMISLMWVGRGGGGFSDDSVKWCGRTSLRCTHVMSHTKTADAAQNPPIFKWRSEPPRNE